MAIKFEPIGEPIIVNGASASGTGDNSRSNSGDATINPNSVGAEAAASGATAAVGSSASGRGPNGRKLNADGTERAPRGSKGTARTAPAPEKAQFSVNGVAFSLAAMHAMAASFLDAPELVLNETESRNFATALQAVQQHYDVQITQKSLDHIQFFAALGSIYGPRIAAIALRKRNERTRRAPQPPSNVVHPTFPQRRTVNEPRPAPVNNHPGETVTVDAEGDPTAAPGNQQNNSRPQTEAERIFSQTPPDLL